MAIGLQQPTVQRGTPAAGSFQFANTKMGQDKMPLLPHRLSLLESSSCPRHLDGGEDDFKLKDEELAIVVHQRSVAVVDGCDNRNGEDEEPAIVFGQQYIPMDDFHDSDGQLDFVPLRIVRPDSVEDEQEEHPVPCYKHGAKKTSSCITRTYKRRIVRPAGSKSAKSKMEQKPALFDSSSGLSGSKSYKDDDLDPSDNDSNFEPSDKDGSFEPSDKDDDYEPKRKRRRPAGSKCTKSKKQPLVYSRLRRRSSSDGKKHKVAYFEPEVSDDDSRNKYACVKDFYGTAWDRAQKVHEKLPAEGPSFVKLMLKSHVVSVFWLALPVNFCRNHLPNHDVTIELEDEDGHIHETNYLANRQGLSGGWSGFAQQHGLKVSDAVVFQLVKPDRFKVYILREDEFTATDVALSLLSLDTSKENNISKRDNFNYDVKSKEDVKVTRLSSKPCDIEGKNLASEEGTEDVGIRSSDTDTGFAAVKSLSNFKIIVDGSVIDGRLLPGVRKTYYNLCCERKTFLHTHLQNRIDPMLAAGVIAETANISEGIRALPASSSSFEDLAAWKRSLEYLELLGMDVAFMRERVEDLLALLSAQSTWRDLQVAAVGYEKLKLERDSTAEKMRALESRMSSLRDVMKEINVAINEMESVVMDKREQAMRKLAAAPW